MSHCHGVFVKAYPPGPGRHPTYAGVLFFCVFRFSTRHVCKEDNISPHPHSNTIEMTPMSKLRLRTYAAEHTEALGRRGRQKKSLPPPPQSPPSPPPPWPLLGFPYLVRAQEESPLVQPDSGTHPSREHRRPLRPGEVDRADLHPVGGRDRHPRPVLLLREVRGARDLRRPEGTLGSKSGGPGNVSGMRSEVVQK